MTEMQATFGETVMMSPFVPVRAHPDDQVVCSDGNTISHCEVCYDCRGGAHSNDQDCHDANVTIVTDILNEEDEWTCEYCTENEDFADPYFCIVDETKSEHADIVERWLEDNWGNYLSSMEELVDAVVDGIDGSFHCCEAVYQRSDYGCYAGDGCCLFSTTIDEYENQVDFERRPALQELHDKGVLDDILDDVNSDAYVCRSRRREKNEETGMYEYVGRETYDPHGSDYPSLMLYHNPGGCWHLIVNADTMKEVIIEAIIRLCRKGGNQ